MIVDHINGAALAALILFCEVSTGFGRRTLTG
jgi:hypothetical protein